MKSESIVATARCVVGSALGSKGIARPRCAYTQVFTAVLALAVAVSPSAQAQTFTVLHAFAGHPTDGAGPHAGLLMDKSGNLYGTTEGGGKPGYGTVFEVNSNGQETVLYNFTGGTDGGKPLGGLIADAKGNLYGTASTGGSRFGTVFKLNAKGKETVLDSFDDTNGWLPNAGLIMDAKGILYGTTEMGGKGYGVVFKMNKKGTETVLHTFARGADGAFPYARLLMDAKGNLYGTTESGGTPEVGTVFKVDKAGEETVLYSFDRAPDGYGPYGGLVMDAKGNLYGAAYDGGAHGFGTVFKVTKTGKETVLYNFAGGSDGSNPRSGLIMDAKGNLYGTTYIGGTGHGTVFKVTSKGKETVLYRFTGGTDGALPVADLVMDKQGNLYGTTEVGGDNGCGAGVGCGTVFKLTP